jgi:hypothetical protein
MSSISEWIAGRKYTLKHDLGYKLLYLQVAQSCGHTLAYVNA